MKLSVLFGVLQMTLGVFIRWSNAFHSSNGVDFMCECIPMLMFMVCFFGWMDFMANVGVNVPAREMLDYMGKLYAEQTVVGDWMQSPVTLSSAMERCWIFQETAFPRLDPGGAEAERP